MARKYTISEIKSLFTNLAQTSHYQVIFGGLPGELLEYLSIRGITSFFVSEDVGLLCNSAQLPTSSFSTKIADGNYTGIQETFATSRIYNDISLTFYVDSDYRSLVFLESWMEYISSGSHNNKSGNLSSISQSQGGYFMRMQYPESYKSDMTRVIKFDRNYGREIEYQFFGLFPFSISSIPITYGASEILNVSVSFKYDRYICGKALSLNSYSGDDNNKNATNPNNPVYNRTGQSLGNEPGVTGTISQPGNVNPIII